MKANTRKVIKYVQKNVYTSIINDIRNVARYHAKNKKKSAGFFAIPRDVFCYVDFLGSLIYDPKHQTVSAIKFIKGYFPKQYKKYADLLYVMWRHGTVHEYAPKTFYCNNSRLSLIGMSWRVENSYHAARRKEHLLIASRLENKRDLYITINNCQLVDDLLIAVKKLAQKLKLDNSLANKADKALYLLQGKRSVAEVRNKTTRGNITNQIAVATKRIRGNICKNNILERI